MKLRQNSQKHENMNCILKDKIIEGRYLWKSENYSSIKKYWKILLKIKIAGETAGYLLLHT